MGRVEIGAPKLFGKHGDFSVRLSDVGRGRCYFPLPNNGIVSTCKTHQKRDKASVGAGTGSAVHYTFSKVMHVTGACTTCKGMIIIHRSGKLRDVCDRGSQGLMGSKSVIGTNSTMKLANEAKHTAARRLRLRFQVSKRRFGPGLVFSVGSHALRGARVIYAGTNGEIVMGRGLAPGG